MLTVNHDPNLEGIRINESNAIQCYLAVEVFYIFGPYRPRILGIYTAGGQLIGLRFNKWKIVFAEQRAKAMDVWSEPFVKLRLPKIFNLRSDPFERADTEANGYHNWRIEHLFLLVPAQSHVAEQMGTFADYPPRQKPAKFNVEEVLNNLKKAKSTD